MHLFDDNKKFLENFDEKINSFLQIFLRKKYFIYNYIKIYTYKHFT